MVSMQYLANAGFRVWEGEREVLVDAIHTQRVYPFSAVPEATLQEILSDQAEGKQRWGLFTHLHKDHCDPKVLTKLCDLKIRLVLPVEGNVRLPEEVRQPRILLRDPIETVTADSKLVISACRTIHDGKNFADNVPHVSYLVDINGCKILFMGDARTSYEPFHSWLEKEPIDAVCVNFVELNQEKGRYFLREVIRPRKIFLCHIPLPEDDVFHYQKLVQKNICRYQSELPPLISCLKASETFQIS